MTLTPLRELLGVTRHTATVSRGVVDLNGALLGGIRDRVGKPMNEDSTWAFVTRDNVPPTVARVSPADGAVNVPGESVVRITFSEPVDPRTVDATSLSVEGPAGVLSGQIDLILGNTVAVFTPTDAGGTRAFLESDASYQVSVSGVVDPAGNLQRPEDAVSVTFRTQDTIAPVVASVGAPPGARPGQLIVVPASVSDADVASVEFFVDGVLVGVVSSPAAPGEYRMTLTMPAKAVQVVARAIDTSGNIGPLTTPVVVGLLSDEPPVVTISEPTPGTVVSPGTTVRFVVNVSDDVAVVRVDGALSGAVTASLGGEIASVPSVTIPFDVDVPASATGGSLTFAAVGTDNQGQASAPATLTVVIADETLPTVQIASPTDGSTVTPGETLEVRVLAQDNVTVSSVSLEASGAASFFESRAVSPAASSVDAIFQVAIPTGATAADTLNLSALAVDAAGNASLAASISLDVLDVNSPVVTLLVKDGVTEVLRGGTLTVTVSATDDIGVSWLDFEAQGAFQATGSAFISPTQPFASNDFVITVPGIASPGTPLTIVGTAQDEAGNAASSVPASITVLENAPPTVSLTAPPDGSQIAAGSTVTLSADADDDLGVTEVEFFVDGVSAGIDTAAPYSVEHTLPSVVGTTSVVIEVFATDNLGQMASDALTITVSSDVTSPRVASVLPADGAVEVAITSLIYVTFSEPITPATITSASFDVRADASPVSGSFSFSSDNTSVRFTPTGDLPFAAVVTIELTEDITDDAGNPLANADGTPLTQPLSFVFTTGSFGITHPLDGSDVVENSEIVLEARGSTSLNITNVTFAVNGEELPVASGTPFIARFITPAAETTPTLSIIATARDSWGSEVAQDQVVVNVLVGLAIEPQLVGIPIGGTATLRLSLSSPSSTDLTVALSAVDPAFVSLPNQVVLTAGQTQALVSVTGAATGNTTILTSSSRGSPAAIVSVSEPVAQQQQVVLAPVVGVAVPAPPSVGQLIIGASDQQTVDVRLVSGAVGADTPVIITSSDPAVADVQGPVVIAAGEQVASLIITTGVAGEATLTLRVGSEVRQITVFVGTPPPGRVPAIVAAPVGVAVLAAPSVGQVIMGVSDEQSVDVRLLSGALSVDTPVIITSSDPTVADVLGPVVIVAGELVAPLSITTGAAGEATLTLRVGTTVRQITVFVGTPPPGRMPAIVAAPVGVFVVVPPSAGPLIMGASEQQTLDVRLLSVAVGVDTPVTITSSDSAVANVQGPVTIAAGEQVAPLTITTGATGEATLTLRVGSEIRQITVFVGTPPSGRVPAIVAPMIAVDVNE
ncbi:MAG: Ig-like domain-containing protein [Deltaproteobacteria bacterium]|nr:Ig-like domain-containing protein [Deltaproteobacteria bacterium]